MTYLAQALGTVLMGIVSTRPAAELDRMNKMLRDDATAKTKKSAR